MGVCGGVVVMGFCFLGLLILVFGFLLCICLLWIFWVGDVIVCFFLVVLAVLVLFCNFIFWGVLGVCLCLGFANY